MTKRYWEVPVTLHFITEGEELSHDIISHGLQMSHIKGLAEFVQGKIIETPEADWTGMFKQWDLIKKIMP